MIGKGKRCEEKGRGRSIFAIPASKYIQKRVDVKRFAVQTKGRKRLWNSHQNKRRQGNTVKKEEGSKPDGEMALGCRNRFDVRWMSEIGCCPGRGK
jgi:hypothetical protein